MIISLLNKSLSFKSTLLHPSVINLQKYNNTKPYRLTSLLSTISNNESANIPPSKWILKYTYVENMLEKRQPYRSDHLALANDYLNKGKIIAGGAFASAEGGMFIFNGYKNDVDEFVNKDVYVEQKLVTKIEIHEWNVVIGKLI